MTKFQEWHHSICDEIESLKEIQPHKSFLNKWFENKQKSKRWGKDLSPSYRRVLQENKILKEVSNVINNFHDTVNTILIAIPLREIVRMKILQYVKFYVLSYKLCF